MFLNNEDIESVVVGYLHKFDDSHNKQGIDK